MKKILILLLILFCFCSRKSRPKKLSAHFIKNCSRPSPVNWPLHLDPLPLEEAFCLIHKYWVHWRVSPACFNESSLCNAPTMFVYWSSNYYNLLTCKPAPVYYYKFQLLKIRRSQRYHRWQTIIFISRQR